MSDAQSKAVIRILVIEDSADDYELLLQHLRAAPFAIEAKRVEDRAGMSTALDQLQWDLVISDHHLPRFGSAAALHLLRGNFPIRRSSSSRE
jgi:CheY-like chemotaxis protein